MDRDVARLVGLAGVRPPLPDDRAFRIRTAVAPAWLGAVRARRRRRLVLVAASALAAALALAVGLALRDAGQPGPGASLAEAARIVGPAPTVVSADGSTAELSVGFVLQAGQRIASGPGRAALNLANGASLRIDAHSEVLLVSEELLELGRGAVYIDSGLDVEGGPSTTTGIAVRTPLGTAFEVGTQFEVRLDGDTLRVRVREGRVRLRGNTSSAEGGPRQEIRLHADGRIDRDTIQVHGAEWSWVVDLAPALTVENQPLGLFLDRVGRETGWTVRYADARLASAASDIVIQGAAGALAPVEALPLVMAACELQYHLDDGVLTITGEEAVR